MNGSGNTGFNSMMDRREALLLVSVGRAMRDKRWLGAGLWRKPTKDHQDPDPQRASIAYGRVGGVDRNDGPEQLPFRPRRRE